MSPLACRVKCRHVEIGRPCRIAPTSARLADLSYRSLVRVVEIGNATQSSGIVPGSRRAAEFGSGMAWIVSGLKSFVETGEPMVAR